MCIILGYRILDIHTYTWQRKSRMLPNPKYYKHAYNSHTSMPLLYQTHWVYIPSVHTGGLRVCLVSLVTSLTWVWGCLAVAHSIHRIDELYQLSFLCLPKVFMIPVAWLISSLIGLWVYHCTYTCGRGEVEKLLLLSPNSKFFCCSQEVDLI